MKLRKLYSDLLPDGSYKCTANQQFLSWLDDKDLIREFDDASENTGYMVVINGDIYYDSISDLLNEMAFRDIL